MCVYEQPLNLTNTGNRQRNRVSYNHKIQKRANLSILIIRGIKLYERGRDSTDKLNEQENQLITHQ